ncbi:glycosyltransferase family 4 protein [Kaistia terrae]|uniref:Glycosyltransferase family 4 protein n=1 Tax=Kaistia terrae TaxID=537017 RepID=A0ABW0PUH1_9HYPH|nr:glycosyltransferase family 4 protein [Kaistia terrae]MCX5576722.1 glycosyltransferase family 4 protein [Kaistia terrae]
MTLPRRLVSRLDVTSQPAFGLDERTAWRILHVISAPGGGGAELLVRELNRMLRLRGISSEVVYLTNPQGVPLEPGEVSLDADSPRSAIACARLVKYLGGVDLREYIVHAHLTWPIYFTALILLFRRRRAVVTEHNTHNRRRNIPGMRWVERIVYGRYSRIFCISDGVRESLAGWLAQPALEQRLRLARNGGRILTFQSDRRREIDRLRIVSVGSLTHKKGFDLALNAIATIKDSVSSYCIVGEGPLRAALQDHAKQLGLSDIVRFVGWQEDPTTFYHEADIALIPSRWEGFGVVAVEALSTGLPIVASDTPGLREVVEAGPANILVDTTNAEGMATAILELRERIGSGVTLPGGQRVAAERHSLDSMADSYIAEYARIA